MANEIQVPSAFQNKTMAKAFQGRVSLDDGLDGGIRQSYPIIRYRGKIWTLQYMGDRKIIVRPDDGSPSGHLDVVILDQNKNLSKSYYAKWEPGSEGDRPLCASMDGIVPDDDVAAKQSDTCALCQRNVWKTDPDSGRKGRECTDHKRLAVLVMPNQTTPLFGHPMLEPVFLRVPPDSLNSLAIMGKTMTGQGFHHSTYLTRITFDPVKAHPSMIFRPVQPLSDAEAEVVLEAQGRESVKRITGETAAAPQGLKLVTAPVTRPAPQHVPQEEEPMLPGLTSLLTAPTPKVVDAPKAKRATKVIAPAPAAPEPAPSLAQGNGLDEGMSEASDDELDAEIAKMISR